MTLAANAWSLRQAARQAIATGDFELGLQLTSKAQELQRTPEGEGLRTIGSLLKQSF